ncbi:hypothetical protein B5K05_23500 [Rhizobium phaseoli]|uniref:hypothetical protein n=1 Tax=Rhizobium phaseoli TaxID=396 RepID=UPI000638241F|nr:hypothetical protein [Rhizobium phaseoli]KKZ84088.1 hypothetical protein RPHASCH2410_PD04075 [Rhizobium phaseoli Ch24-10]RDJ05018.1 hypothetical protein B5K04_23435 [Rhizobium phaseoli]RDJ07261.1 hypothetical protein B5K05_23500 [Rhizobium phaseoli]
MRPLLGAFSIDSGVGATVILKGRCNLPFGKALCAKINIPGKEIIEAIAYKDWPHQRPVANAGYLLMGVSQTDLIEGTTIKIELP